MNYFDEVKLTVNKPEYEKCGVFAGEIGIIWQAEIRDNCFYVMFEKEGDPSDFYKYCVISVGDLELVKKSDYITDNKILAALPNYDPRWWCKVEDGYIINLKGERKNKIPYKYDS